MQLYIHTRNLELTDWLESYVQKKLGKLDRYLPSIEETRVELTSEPTKNSNHSQVCEVTVRTKGSILRAEERAGDMRDAIDRVVEKMYKQIARYKGKRERNKGRAPAEPMGEALHIAVEEVEETEAPQIVRRKRFPVVPMDEQEAIEQMELLGHDFFLFYNVDTSQINVVYRRKDGNYGLLEPEVM